MRSTGFALFVCAWLGLPAAAVGQVMSERGFVDVRAAWFPEDAKNDSENLVLDVALREEAFARPARWVQFAAGLDLRANTHEQVDRSWRIDLAERGKRRPALSVRRLSASLTRGALAVDVGKQFIRWGKTDIVTPTDRFAPRDFLNVVDADFLAVTGVRGTLQRGSETFEAVWVPFFTPSRMPLIDQRWSVVPPSAGSISLVEADGAIPHRSQAGVRWAHVGGFEYSVSVFDGFNTLPTIDVRPPPAVTAARPVELEVSRRYAAIRTYGGDVAVPTRWVTIKSEGAYFTSRDDSTDEYVLYVVQVERQAGEWLLVGGYAGEAVTRRRSAFSFAPDRGFARAVVGRASYTIDATRTVALETAVRQGSQGLYAKAEYSQARGQHWRASATGVVLRGSPDDFLGQFRLNSHVTLSLRYSF